MRGLLTAALAASVLMVMAGAAAAHGVYVRSNPASDARLTRAPTEVRVTFSETPDARGSDIAVLDTSGARLDLRDVTAVSDEADTLRVSLGPIGEGGYLVSWTVLSAVDGHETKGAFAFAVGNAPLPKIPDVGPATPPPTPSEIAGRFLSFAGIALLIGLGFFTIFIKEPIDKNELRRERWLMLVGGGLLVGSTALLLLPQIATTPARLLTLLGLRALAGVATIAVVVLRRLLPPDVRREAVSFFGLAAGLTATLVSHAAASGDLRYIALDYLHVIAISIWLGGVVTFAFVVMPSAHAVDPRRLGDTVWRFSLTALAAVAVLITTGVLQSLDRLVLLEDLYETPYGIALLAKILLLVGLLGLGALNLLVWGPRMRRGVAASRPFWRGVTGETALFGGVLVAAAFLTAFAPPAQASGAAFDDTTRVDGVRIQLLAASTLPGRNRFIVRVQQGLAPVVGAEKVALRFTMVEHDMGEQELIASERAPGEYVAEGSPMAMFGTWKVEAIVRLTGRQDIRGLFDVPVSQPAGQDATTKIVAVPPYQLLVFSEPFQPQAGAPLTINVVVVDTKGDPVIGKKLRAMFSGPGTAAPLDSVENVAELGPGRYRFMVPGLDAGSWKITISVSDAGSGLYELVVSR